MDNRRDPAQGNAFTKWLQRELDARRWQPKDLADAAGVSLNQVLLVLKHERNPGDKFLRGTAAAFGMPQETIFRLAGLLTDGEIDDVKEDEAARKIKQLLAALDPQGRERAIRLLEQYVRDHAASAAGAYPANRQA
ncbi:MAG: hypothetical protein M1434_06365 [Chloroflexi bacterium]|nr:hypothetical protein [Chloroflexota bacterium]MCL5274359.1 hypothetical protein [Chloroflexota bacterium]